MLTLDNTACIAYIHYYNCSYSNNLMPIITKEPSMKLDESWEDWLEIVITENHKASIVCVNELRFVHAAYNNHENCNHTNIILHGLDQVAVTI